MGVGIITSDVILKQIIDRACIHKLDSIKTLLRENRWNRADVLGKEVLELAARLNPRENPSTSRLLSAHSFAMFDQEFTSPSMPTIPLECLVCGEAEHDECMIAQDV